MKILTASPKSMADVEIVSQMIPFQVQILKSIGFFTTPHVLQRIFLTLMVLAISCITIIRITVGASGLFSSGPKEYPPLLTFISIVGGSAASVLSITFLSVTTIKKVKYEALLEAAARLPVTPNYKTFRRSSMLIGIFTLILVLTMVINDGLISLSPVFGELLVNLKSNSPLYGLVGIVIKGWQQAVLETIFVYGSILLSQQIFMTFAYIAVCLRQSCLEIQDEVKMLCLTVISDNFEGKGVGNLEAYEDQFRVLKLRYRKLCRTAMDFNGEFGGLLFVSYLLHLLMACDPISLAVTLPTSKFTPFFISILLVPFTVALINNTLLWIPFVAALEKVRMR